MTSMSSQDKGLLVDLCRQHNVDPEKVVKLLETVREYEFKDRRTGVYDALREVLRGRAEDSKR